VVRITACRSEALSVAAMDDALGLTWYKNAARRESA
jgi:hypothetical protein